MISPLLSTPCTWNTDFARSIPTVMATMAQASLNGVAVRPPRLPRPGGARAVHAIKWAVQRARYMTLEPSRPCAMISPSCCPAWPHEPERPDPPRRSRPPSYTTSRDTTHESPRNCCAGQPLPCRSACYCSRCAQAPSRRKDGDER
jgi:hypothetical protein